MKLWHVLLLTLALACACVAAAVPLGFYANQMRTRTLAHCVATDVRAIEDTHHCKAPSPWAGSVLYTAYAANPDNDPLVLARAWIRLACGASQSTAADQALERAVNGTTCWAGHNDEIYFARSTIPWLVAVVSMCVSAVLLCCTFACVVFVVRAVIRRSRRASGVVMAPHRLTGDEDDGEYRMDDFE